MATFTTASPEETLELGGEIGRRLAPGAVVGLDGDLGAGKTWIAKGIVRGLGDFAEELVKSPAYNLVHEYPVETGDGPLPVLHIDFYRLEELGETDRLLFAEYFERDDAVVLVEWADRFLAELVPGYLSVRLAPVPGGGTETRRIELSAVGDAPAAARVLAELDR